MVTNTTAMNDGGTVDQNSAFIPSAENKELSSVTVKNMTLAEESRTYVYTTAVHVERYRERPWAFRDGPRMLVRNIASALSKCNVQTERPLSGNVLMGWLMLSRTRETHHRPAGIMTSIIYPVRPLLKSL